LKPLTVVAIAFLASLVACNHAQNTSTASTADAENGNLAPVDQSAAAPPATDTSAYPAGEAADTSAQAVEAPDPPPPLPDYSQPPCPGDDYVWTPGYWDYASAGYYWVPGAWVMAPYVGALWTPPWWGYDNGVYLWHAGYWGAHIGFYGGVDYGFGYTGHGYYGAYWNGGHLFYNRSVTNVNTNVVHNLYNYRVSERPGRVSYNGGRGGIDVRPTAQESAAVRERHTPPVAAQVQNVREAAGNREQFAAGRNGKPANVVAQRPLATAYRAPAERAPEARPAQRTRESRPAGQPAVPAAAERARPQPEARPAPQERRAEQPAQRPAAPEAHPQETHANREVRPQSPPPVRRAEQPAQRPAAPEAHPQETHANREVRPQSPPRPSPPERPAPQQHAAPPHPAPVQHAAPPHPAPHEHEASPEKKKQ